MACWKHRFSPRVMRILAIALCISAFGTSTFAAGALSGDAATFNDPSGANSLKVGGTAAGGSASFTPPGPDSFNAVVIGAGGNGSVSVSGTGAALDATNAVTTGASTTGSLSISNGGVVNSQGGPSPFSTAVGANSTIVGDDAGAAGTVTVTGAGSQFNIGSGTGSGNFLVVGDGFVGGGAGIAGATTTGTLNVLNGASLTSPGAIVGNHLLSSGAINVSGAGSQWTVNQIGATEDAFLDLGVNGTGTVNLTNGALVSGLRIGGIGIGPGGIGSLNVDASTLNMIGAFEQFGPSLLIGEQNGATGTVSVTNGGKININGVGTPGAEAPGIIVGGSGVTNVVGTGSGTLNIQGAGSEVLIEGDQDHTSGIFATTGLTVGQSGTGVMNITQGGNLTIVNTSGGPQGGLSIGGNILQAQLGQASGTGDVVVSDPGSTINITTVHGGLAVGDDGPGNMSIENGAVVNVGGTGVFVGFDSGATGNLSVDGAGSILSTTGGLEIGTNGGSGVVSLNCGGAIGATNVNIGANATLGGCGTISGNVVSNGTLKAGASPDALNINGNLQQNGGTIDFQIDPNGHGGFLTSTLVLGTGKTLAINGTKIDFSFLDGANPTEFAASGLFDLDTFFRVDDPNGGTDPISSLLGNGAPLDSLFTDMTYVANSPNFDFTSFAFATDSGVTSLTGHAVPEPMTIVLFGTALVGFGLMRRYKMK